MVPPFRGTEGATGRIAAGGSPHPRRTSPTKRLLQARSVRTCRWGKVRKARRLPEHLLPVLARLSFSPRLPGPGSNSRALPGHF